MQLFTNTVDENIEYLKCYENRNPIKDVFYYESWRKQRGLERIK